MDPNDGLSSESTAQNNDKSIFHIPYCDDPIVEQGLYAQAFANIRERYSKDESERCIFRGCHDFYNFLKNAYYVLDEQIDYLKFCKELELDQDAQARYKMKEFLDECTRKLSELQKDQNFLLDEKSEGPHRKKASKRVSFNLAQNKIKYFLQEHCNLHHGNYTKLDKKEGQVLKSDIWLHPIQLKQRTEFKTRSHEINIKRNILKIPSGQFLSTENLITDLRQNKTIELTLTNLNKRNEFHGIPRVKVSDHNHVSTNLSKNTVNQNYHGQNSSFLKNEKEGISNSKNDSQLILDPVTDPYKKDYVTGSSPNIEQPGPCNSSETRNSKDKSICDRNTIHNEIIDKSFTGNKTLLKNILMFFN